MGQEIMLNSNQSVPLKARAGNDVTMISGNSNTLGEDPSALDRYGSYIYLRSPSVGRDDPTDANLLLDILGVSGSLILKVINSTGVAVHQVNWDPGPFFREELDTRFFPKGNYFVMLIYRGRVITKSVIIL